MISVHCRCHFEAHKDLKLQTCTIACIIGLQIGARLTEPCTFAEHQGRPFAGFVALFYAQLLRQADLAFACAAVQPRTAHLAAAFSGALCQYHCKLSSSSPHPHSFDMPLGSLSQCLATLLEPLWLSKVPTPASPLMTSARSVYHNHSMLLLVVMTQLHKLQGFTSHTGCTIQHGREAQQQQLT